MSTRSSARIAPPGKAPADWCCPVCGSRRWHDRAALGNVAVVECRRCGAWFAAGEVQAISEQYAREFFERHPWRYDEPAEAMSTHWRRLLARLERCVGSKGRLLDVGSGTGAFVEQACRLGWQAQGVEPAAAGRELAERRSGLRLAPNMDKLSGGFDAATLLDVLEHAPDVVGLLRQTARKLRPGGIVALTTPNVAALGRRLFGRRWRFLDVAQHVVLLGPKSARLALAQAGLDVLEMTTRMSAAAFVEGLSHAKVTKPVAGRHARALGGLKRLVDRASSLFFLGDTLEVIACKRAARADE